MGRLPPNPALAFTGRTQNTCSTAQPPIAEPIPDCEQNVPAQCDLTEGVSAYPREPGENLFCYYQRLFQIVFTGGDSSAYLSKFNNLSELTNPATARTNLGLGSVLSDISTLQGDLATLSGDLATLQNDVSVNTADIGLLQLDFNNLGTLSAQNANAIAVTGGSITGITDLAVADGGTGASTPAGARVNILPSLGGQAGKVLAVNGTSTDVEWITPAGGTSSVTVSSTPPVSPSLGDLWWDNEVGQLKIWYVDANSSQWVDSGSGGGGGSGGGVSSVTASGVLSSSGGLNPNITLTGVVPIANGGTGASDNVTAISNLGLGSVLTDISDLRTDVSTLNIDVSDLRTDFSNLGTMAAQYANNVGISGGFITGITDLAVADGGTGASSAPAARSNLGLGTAATRADSYFLQSANNLSDLPSPSTARTNLGVSSSSDVMLRANNFSDVGNVTVARANLGLGTMASQDASLVYIDGGFATLSALAAGSAVIGLLALTPTPGYPTSGAIALRFDIGNNIYIPLAGAATFSILGMSAGRVLTLNIRNTTGASIALTWPAWYPTGNAFPSSLGANESLCVRAECYGTAASDVYAQCVTTSSPGVTRVFNVRNYGAVGDGSTNDGPAINLAIADLNLFGGTLYFPEGTYAVATTLTEITNNTTVLGDGQGVSVLLFQGSVGGIYFNFSAARKNAACRGLRFRTTSVRTQTALRYRQYNDATLGQPFDFQSLEFGPDWQYAINVDNLALNNSQGGNISNVFIEGTNGGGSPECYGIRLAGCSNITVLGAKIFNVHYGIVAESSPLCEGSWISDVIVVNCKYGVWAKGANTWLTNIHANVSTSFGTGGASFYIVANECHVNNCYALGNDATASALRVEGNSTVVLGLRAINTTGVRWLYGIYEVSGFLNQYGNCTLTNVSTAIYLGGSYSQVSNIIFNDCLAAPAIVDNLGLSRISECLGAGSNVDSSWNKPYFVYATWDPANLTPGQQDFLNITVDGAAFGMGVVLAPPYDLQNMSATAQVTSANTVRITLLNSSNTSVDLGSGSWGVKLVR